MSPEPAIEKPAAPLTCWACRAVITQGDEFCRRCGRRQMRGDTWYYRAGWILFLSLTVMGPLALPLVWRSPHLSRSEKWILGSAITAYSVFVLALGAWLIVLMWRHFTEIYRLSQQLG